MACLSVQSFGADSFEVNIKSDKVMTTDEAVSALYQACYKKTGTKNIQVDIVRFYLNDSSINQDFPATDISALCILNVNR